MVKDTNDYIKNKKEYAIKRINDMQSEREPFEKQWNYDAQQVEAKAFEDPDTGKFYPNIKIEQAIIEMRLWSQSWDILFDVEPDEHDPDLEEAMKAKHILKKFMHEEKFHQEMRRWRHNKAVYGTAIFWTGITHNMRTKVKRKEVEVRDQIGSGIFDKSSKERVYHEVWEFLPKNLSVYNVMLDDNALYQNDQSKIEDCVIIESGSKEKIMQRWANVPWINRKALESLEEIDRDDSWDYGITTPRWKVILYHYFNKITRDWIIIGNKSEIIYNDLYDYECEGLPVEITQHHPKTDSIYGISEPQMVASIKAVMNSTWEAMISGALLSTSALVLQGWSWEFTDSNDTNAEIYSWEVSMKQVTNSVDDFKQINTNVNVGPLASILEMSEINLMTATGVDIKSPFEINEQNLWQTEIREENKAIRWRSLDELEDYWLSNALTASINNIIKFAPRLLVKENDIKLDGKKEKVHTPYKLSIPDVDIKEDGTIEADLGNYWQLEFKEDTISGYLKVRVTTSSNNNNKLQAIEKNKMKELVNTVQMLWQTYGPKVYEIIPLDYLWWLIQEANGYADADNTAKSKKAVNKERNREMIEEMKNLLNWIPQNDVQTNPQWWVQTAQTAPQWAPVDWGWWSAQPPQPAWSLV